MSKKKVLQKISVVDRNRMVRFCKKGFKANGLMDIFPQYSRQQIAAIVAWVTMGKY